MEENKLEEKKDEEKEKEINKGNEQEQSVHDTQLPPPSPPHTITPTETINIKDVADTSCQNINPSIVEDLSKILDQSTQLAQLCSSPILVSVDEL